MKWKLSEPAFGDMIRVKSGSIYHYGIYLSDSEIIQFGNTPEAGVIVPDCCVRVIASDVDSFLMNGFLEVAELSFFEKRRRRTPKDTALYARARLGEGGYNILNNNCEHFAYECLFGKGKSEQSENARALLRNSPFTDVYITKIPEGANVGRLSSRERMKEIRLSGSESERAEKYFSFLLLKIAAYQSLGIDIDKIKLKRSESGKWRAKELELSISHSKGYLCVAVSKSPVGVDIEPIRELSPLLADEVLTAPEREAMSALPETQRDEYLLRAFCAKEAYFKYSGGEVFEPDKINAEELSSLTDIIKIDGEASVYSVYTDNINSVRIFTEIKF